MRLSCPRCVPPIVAARSPSRNIFLVLWGMQAEEEGEDTAAAAPAFQEDAADVDRRNEAERARLEAEEFARRSSALQREPALPRVTSVDDDAIVASSVSSSDAKIAAAEKLIAEEVVDLLQHDAIKYPVRVCGGR